MKGDFDILLYLAEKSNLLDKHKSSTIDIAKDIGLSQQTVSRRLIKLEQKGLIKRIVSQEGITFSMDKKGIDVLKQVYKSLNKVFCADIKSLNGTVVSGLGEGAYYTSKYKDKIREQLGFSPFLGTLNLNVDENNKIRFLSMLEEKTITGFKDKERAYGSLRCYKISIKGSLAFIALPERSTHKENMLEIISSINLRKVFKFRDGDNIILER